MEHTVWHTRTLSDLTDLTLDERDRYSVLLSMVKRLGPDACFFYIPLPYHQKIYEAQQVAFRSWDVQSYDSVPPHLYHITLLTLPSCPDDILAAVIAEVAQDLPPTFKLTVSALDSFAEAPTSPLIARVDAGPHLIRLQDRLVHAARRHDLEIGPHMRFDEYHPHITLAMNVVPAQFAVPKLPAPFQLEVTKVMASRAHYQTVGQISLSPPGPPPKPLDNITIERGGTGSGFRDHRGRPGKVGGSLPRGAVAAPSQDEIEGTAEGRDGYWERWDPEDRNEILQMPGDMEHNWVAEGIKQFARGLGIDVEDIAIFDVGPADFISRTKMFADFTARGENPTLLRLAIANELAGAAGGTMELVDGRMGIWLHFGMIEMAAKASGEVGMQASQEEILRSETARSTLFHEMGHAIDHLSGVQSEDKFSGQVPLPYKLDIRRLKYPDEMAASEYRADLIAAILTSTGDPRYDHRSHYRKLRSVELSHARELIAEYRHRMGLRATNRAAYALRASSARTALISLPFEEGIDGFFEVREIDPDILTDEERAEAHIYILPAGGAPEEAEAPAVTKSQMLALLRGEHIVMRPLGRILTLRDGPFQLIERGGEGSGYHDPHIGRPGEVGGSRPRGHPSGQPAVAQKLAKSKELEDLMRSVEEGERTEGLSREEMDMIRDSMADAIYEALENGELAPLHTYSQDAFVHNWGPERPDKRASEMTHAELDVWMTERRVKDKLWERAMGHAISMGEITLEDAQALGLSFPNSDYEQGYGPLPEKMWHVTTAIDAVLEEGLKSRAELNQERGKGLGGGDDESISFTADPEYAHVIYNALVEARKAARGEITIEDMIDQAMEGTGARAPFAKHLLENFTNQTWDPGDPLPLAVQDLIDGIERYKMGLGWTEQKAMRKLDGEGWRPDPDHGRVWETTDGEPLYTYFVREKPADELQWDRFQFYKRFTTTRQWAGGPEDPMFFMSDPKGLAQIDEDQIAIVEVEGRGYGFRLGALGEWRTMTGKAVEVTGTLEPDEWPTRVDIFGEDEWREWVEEQFPDIAEGLKERAIIADPTKLSMAMLGDTVGASGPGVSLLGEDLEIYYYENPEAIPVGTKFYVIGNPMRGVYLMDQYQVVERLFPADNLRVELSDLINALDQGGFIEMQSIDLRTNPRHATGFPGPEPVHKKPGRRIEPWVYADPTDHVGPRRPKVEFALDETLSVPVALSHLPHGSMFDRKDPEPNWATGKWVRRLNREGKVVWYSVEKGLEAYDSEWADLFETVADIEWVRLLRPFDVEALADWAHAQSDIQMLTASYRTGAGLTNERGDPVERDDYLVVYHGTTAEEAERMIKYGAVPETKPMNASRLRYEAGVNPLPFLFGEPVSNRVYVTAKPRTARRFGEAVVAIRVKPGELALSPEVLARGWTRASWHLVSGLASGEGVVVARDIRPGEFFAVIDLDNPLAGLKQRYDEGMGLEKRVAGVLRGFVDGLGRMLGITERHASPIHPGTGTDQQVHAGGGGGADYSQTTSAMFDETQKQMDEEGLSVAQKLERKAKAVEGALDALPMGTEMIIEQDHQGYAPGIEGRWTLTEMAGDKWWNREGGRGSEDWRPSSGFVDLFRKGAESIRAALEDGYKGVSFKLGDDLTERGGPGSGFEGHRGRPGRVGGSLPRGVSPEAYAQWQAAQAQKEGEGLDEIRRLEEEAQDIGGRRGAFANMIKKFQRILENPLDFKILGEEASDEDLQAILNEFVDEADMWRGDAAGILGSIRAAMRRWGEAVERYTEVDEIDEERVEDLREHLRVELMEGLAAGRLSDFENRLDDWYSGTAGGWEGIRERLGIEKEEFDAMSTDAIRARIYRDVFMDYVRDEIVETGDIAEEDIFKRSIDSLERMGINPLEEYMVSAEGYLVEQADEVVGNPSNAAIIAEYGALPTRGRIQSTDQYEFKPPPDEWLIVGREDDGEIVSAAFVKRHRGEQQIGLSRFDFMQREGRWQDVDYDRDIRNKDYLYVSLLASKRSHKGYGTEAMLQILNMAAERGWGIVGESVPEAAGFYAKLGGKFVMPGGERRGGLAFWTPNDVKKAATWMRRADRAMHLGLGRVLGFVARAADGRKPLTLGFNIVALMLIDDDPAALMAPLSYEEALASHHQFIKSLPRELTERGGPNSGYHDPHYGRPGRVGGSRPRGSGGAEAGTAVAGEESRRVGLTSAKPGKEAEAVYSEAEAFGDILRGLAGVRDVHVEAGTGGWEGGSEPTWVVQFRGDGAATSLIAQTAKQYDQDAAVIFEPCPGAEQDCQNTAHFRLGRRIQDGERRRVEQVLIEKGIGGWTWYRDIEGGAVLFVSEIPQWGTHLPHSKIESLRNDFNSMGYETRVDTGRVKVNVMEREGPNRYDRYIQQ